MTRKRKGVTRLTIYQCWQVLPTLMTVHVLQPVAKPASKTIRILCRVISGYNGRVIVFLASRPESKERVGPKFKQIHKNNNAVYSFKMICWLSGHSTPTLILPENSLFFESHFMAVVNCRFGSGYACCASHCRFSFSSIGLLYSILSFNSLHRQFICHCAFFLAMATLLRKTFTTDVGQMQWRGHHLTMLGLQLSCFLRASL